MLRATHYGAHIKKMSCGVQLQKMFYACEGETAPRALDPRISSPPKSSGLDAKIGKMGFDANIRKMNFGANTQNITNK